MNRNQSATDVMQAVIAVHTHRSKTMTWETHQDLRDASQPLTDQQKRRILDRQNGVTPAQPGPGGAVPEGHDPRTPFLEEELNPDPIDEPMDESFMLDDQFDEARFDEEIDE